MDRSYRPNTEDPLWQYQALGLTPPPDVAARASQPFLSAMSRTQGAEAQSGMSTLDFLNALYQADPQRTAAFIASNQRWQEPGFWDDPGGGVGYRIKEDGTGVEQFSLGRGTGMTLAHYAPYAGLAAAGGLGLIGALSGGGGAAAGTAAAAAAGQSTAVPAVAGAVPGAIGAAPVAAGAGAGAGTAATTGAIGTASRLGQAASDIGRVASGAAAGSADQRGREANAQVQAAALNRRSQILAALLSGLQDASVTPANPNIAARTPQVTGGLRPSAALGGGNRQALISMLQEPVNIGAGKGENALGAIGLGGQILGAVSPYLRRTR